MKKIISIVAVLAIVFSFSVTAFAATATMAVAPVEVDVAAGTQDVNVSVVFTMDEATSLYGIALNFELPDGVTLKSVDPAALAAICPTASNDEVMDLASGSYSYFEGSVEGTSAVDSLTIPCVLTVDTTEAKTYTVSFAEGSGVCDIETYEAINATCPAFTITVKGNDPVTYYGTPVVAEDEIVIGETTYTGVALINVVCDFGSQDATDATKFGYLLKDSSDDDREKDIEIGTSITGGGAVEATFVFYNIADASTISATPYFVK